MTHRGAGNTAHVRDAVSNQEVCAMTKIDGSLVGGTPASGEASTGGTGVAVLNKPSKAAKGGAVDALQDVKAQRANGAFRTSGTSGTSSKFATSGKFDTSSMSASSSKFATSAKAKFTQTASALFGSSQKPGSSETPGTGYASPTGPQSPSQGQGMDPFQKQQRRQNFMNAVQQVNYSFFSTLEKDAEKLAEVVKKAAETTNEASRKV
jgi:hypothetical protein